MTSTYLTTHAGFDDCTAETSDVAAKTIKNYSSNGWTNASTGSYTTIAVTAYGGGKKVANSTTPSTKKDGETVSGNTLGIIAGWGDDVKIQSGDITLPAGFYTLTVDHYLTSSTSNYGTSRFGFVTSGTSYIVSSTTYSESTWTTETVTFTLTTETTGKIQIGVKGNNKEGSGAPAVFYDDVKLTYIPFADATDYKNLKSAISTVEAKTFGFDVGEYAPYNYVDVLEALASAKAINQSGNNLQTIVQALTATLNGASWTANGTEVNAFYDGSFTDAASVTGNTCPKGWHGSDSHYTDGYWVRLMHTDGSSNTGLRHFTSNSAMMAKSTPRYGLDAGYTMPLNEATYYTLSFDFAGWGGGNSSLYTTIVITDGSDNTMTVYPSKTETQNENGQSSTEVWKTYTGIFQTGTAGNYKLLLSKTEGDGSGYQITYGDMVLKKTTVAEATTYYNSVKSAVEGDYEDGVYGGDEKTTFKAALDADVPATVAEIMTAAAQLQTKHDTYVDAKPSYAKFVTEKTSAIAIGVTTEAANAVTMTTAAGLDDALHALYVLEDAAANSGYPVNATTLFGSWTTQNLATKNEEHWSGNTVTYYDKWDANGFTSSITSTVTLPAGKYVFKLAARAQSGGINGAFNMSVKIGDADAVYKDFVAKDNTGKGIATSGAVNYGAGTFANDNNGRGWEWRFIGFELDAEASVEMKGYAQIYGGKWVGFTDATLLTTSDNVAVLKNLLSDEITAANAIYAGGANVGTGVFQYPSLAASTFDAAINTTAQGVYDNASATSNDVSNAIDALKAAEETYIQSINAPTDGKRYCIKVATAGHAKFGNAWVVNRGVTSANNPTGYTILASATPAAYLNQAIIFTQVSGNTYNISIERPEGTVYLTYGSLNGSAADWKKMQIQGTTDSEKKGIFKIFATTTDNVFKIYNTEQKDFIDCQDGGNIYTDTSIEKDLFTLEEASQASVTINTTEAGWGTVLFPFNVALPDGDDVKAYTCAAVDGNTLTLVEVDALAANTPYIIEGSWDETKDGWGSASENTYTVGLLTGVYTETEAPDGSYVLAKINDKVAFYLVDNTDKPTVGANRCYLTVSDGARALFFPGEETGIEAINALTSGEVKIFNASGAQIPALQKGMNIVKQSNGKSYKVIVK